MKHNVLSITAVLASAGTAFSIPHLSDLQKEAVIQAHIDSLPAQGNCTPNELILLHAAKDELRRLSDEAPKSIKDTEEAGEGEGTGAKESDSRTHRQQKTKTHRQSRRKTPNVKGARKG